MAIVISLQFSEDLLEGIKLRFKEVLGLCCNLLGLHYLRLLKNLRDIGGATTVPGEDLSEVSAINFEALAVHY